MADPEVVADASTPPAPDVSPSTTVQTPTPSDTPKTFRGLTSIVSPGDDTVSTWLGLKPFSGDSGLKTAEDKPVISNEEMRAAVDSRKQDMGEVLRALNDDATTQKNIYEKLTGMPRPSLPELKDIPKSPRSQLRSSLEVFRNPLMVAAIFGMLGMRGGAKNAMVAATGAMEGFNTGDKERIKLEHENFKLNLEQVQAANELALKKYDIDTKQRTMKGQDYLNEIHASAMELEHKMMADQAKQGNFQGIHDIWKALQANKTAIEKAKMAADERLRKEEKKEAPLFDQETIDSLGKMWAQGNQNVLRGFWGKQGGATRAAIMQSGIKDAIASGKSPQEINRLQQIYAAEGRGVAQIEQQIARITTAISQAQRTAGRVLETSKNVPRTSIMKFNEWEIAAKRQTGDPNVVKFNIALETFINNYAAAIVSRGYHTTNEARQHAYGMITSAMSSGQVQAAIDQMEREMKDELAGAKDSRNVYLSRPDESGGGGGGGGGDTDIEDFR